MIETRAQGADAVVAANPELRAQDVMTADPVCVSPSTGIRELARVLEEHEISGVPVTDQQGRVVGVVSKTDLIRRCAEGTDDLPPAYYFEVLSDQGDDEETSEVIPEPLVCVEDFMTEAPLMVGPEVSIAAIAKMMFERRIHRVIVADAEGFPLGIITTLDLLGVFPQRERAAGCPCSGQSRRCSTAKKEPDMNTVTTPTHAGGKKAVSPARLDDTRAGTASNGVVTADKIRARAYEIYLNRRGNGGAGSATSDWLQAELELNGSKQSSRQPKGAEARPRGDVMLGADE